jgi:hypothetical protein
VISIPSFQRAAFGVAAVCLLAAALLAPIGFAGVGAAATAADVLPGDSTCIPVKSQTPRPDLIPAGLTPSGTEVIVKNVGCGPTLNGFNVWIALTDGVEIKVAVERIEQLLRPGDAVRVPIAFDCQFDSAYVHVDREQITRDTNPDNNTATFPSIVC